MTTAETIKALRTKAGIHQQQLAERLGVKQQKISEWENGKHEPRHSTMLSIIEICNEVNNDKK